MNGTLGPVAAVLAVVAAPPLPAVTPAGVADGATTSIRLVDVASERGLAFVHSDGRETPRFIVETTGSGVCVLDHDGDGDDDVYLVDGGFLPEPGGDDPAAAPARGGSRLFRNDGGRFRDVTAEAGVAGHGWGMGCAVADVDADGDADLFVTNYGPDELFLNDGAGRFRDVAPAVGLDDPAFNTSAAFADFDGDGRLDLYVGSYVSFTPGAKSCSAHSLPVVCGPREFEGRPGRLHRGLGSRDGLPRFRDVTKRSGAVEPVGKTLGVLFEDLTGDGLPDLYLANDTVRNTLLVNAGDGRFRDRTVLAGVGLSSTGLPEAGMGVDAGDLDGDGRPEIVVTNFHLETNTLYRALDGRRWLDSSDSSGMGQASLVHLAFGINLGDLDLDGDLDVFTANGHVEPNVAAWDDVATYAQPDQVMENLGWGDRPRLSDVSATALEGPVAVSRGSALLDLEGDGDLDVVVNANNGPAILLENRSERAGRRWLVVRLRGPAGNVDGVGALVSATAGGRTQHRRVRTSSSFLASTPARAHFGLGEAQSARVVVTWPDGTVQQVGTLGAEATHVVVHPDLAGPPARSAPAPRPSGAASRGATDADGP